MGLFFAIAIAVAPWLKPTTMVSIGKPKEGIDFSEFAETVNGRIAQVAFPLFVLSEHGDGNLLEEIVSRPAFPLILTAVVAVASLPPAIEAAELDHLITRVGPLEAVGGLLRAAVPPVVRRGLMRAYFDLGLDDIFNPAAEQTNSRWAMFALGLCLMLGYAHLAVARRFHTSRECFASGTSVRLTAVIGGQRIAYVRHGLLHERALRRRRRMRGAHTW